MHRSEVRWKENTTSTFLKTVPSEIHSYKLLLQLYRNLFGISNDLNYLNRISTGSRLIVTSLMKVFRIQCCFDFFFFFFKILKSYGQHVLKSCARLEDTYKSSLKCAVYFGRSEMKHLFLRWMKVNMLTAPSKVCLVEELGEHWCNLSQ